MIELQALAKVERCLQLRMMLSAVSEEAPQPSLGHADLHPRIAHSQHCYLVLWRGPIAADVDVNPMCTLRVSIHCAWQQGSATPPKREILSVCSCLPALLHAWTAPVRRVFKEARLRWGVSATHPCAHKASSMALVKLTTDV